MLLYAVGCAVAATVGWAAGDLWLPVLFATSGLVAVLGWRLVRWPDNWSRYFSFGALLLLMCVLNRVFYIADYFIAGARFDEWPFPVLSPQVALFKAEVITLIGTFITVLAWKLSGGMRISPALALQRENNSYVVLVVAYAISLIAMSISALRPVVAASLGQLLPTLLGLGLVCAFLVPVVRVRNGLRRLVLVSTMSAPFILLAAGTGMKENIILAILPTAIVVWRFFRHPIVRVAFVPVGIVTLGLITSYVNFYRATVWNSDTQESSEYVLQNFVDQARKSGIDNTTSAGVEGFIKRNNASIHRGFAVSIADEQRLYPSLVFSPLIYVFVPRILWPEKPLIRQGWEYSGVVFGQQYISLSDSSMAAGLYPSLYLGGGWSAFILGAILIGALLAIMTRIALRFGGTMAASLYIFSMLPSIIRLDETWTVGAVTGPVISCAYVLAIMGLTKMVSAIISRPAIVRSR